MSILNIGTRALTANQLALQTAGNNIANVNTPGYSRQTVVLQNVEGQYSGKGYYGNGVEAATVLRNHSDYLTRQVATSGSVSAADSKRLELLKQLEDYFPAGADGLGASIGNLLNAFSDVASAPTNLPARVSVLAYADETAARFSSTAASVAGLRQQVRSEIAVTVDKVNSLAAGIARANAQVVLQQGSGHVPNDLLDQREELVRQLGALVQTTTIPASDGSIGIFLAGSQPLVLGKTVTPVTLQPDEFGDPAKSKLAIKVAGANATLEEAALGGGSLSGLLRFQNTDLVDADNLLGRMALALGTSMNDQHHLGLDLNGAAGGDLFTMGNPPATLAAVSNTGSATLTAAIQTTPVSGAAELAASDYEVAFTGAGTGTIKRASDGLVTSFGSVPVQIDGLTLQVGGAAAAGDRFLITPFRQAAASMDNILSSPRALAAASPVAASAGSANTGTLAVQSLLAKQADPNLTQTVTLTFTGAGTFDVAGTGTGSPTGVAYLPGQEISYNGWALTLKGTPQAGDSFTVQANAFPTVNSGNAQAMLALRDAAMFDGAAATDGYGSLLAQVGVRVQSAGFAAAVSKSIASNAVTDQAAVSGVNLDEEAAKLLQFQQAYQASAKILQVSQTMFDTLIQNLAR